jgi:hypothetical protein
MARNLKMLEASFGMEEIALNDCSIDNDGTFVLFSALATSSALKILTIGSNESITELGWEVCLPFLHESNAPLEELYFADNNINDIGADRLVEFVADIKSTIQILDVMGIAINIKDMGIFARILQPGSSSQLQDLRIGPHDGGDLNDDVVRCFAAALSWITSRFQVLDAVHLPTFFVTKQKKTSPVLSTPTTHCATFLVV